MMRRFAIIIVLALCLVGCGEPVKGEVVSKTVVPARQWIYMQPTYSTTCSGSGTTRVCTTSVSGYVPITMHKPECPQLSVDTVENGVKGVCVSHELYETTEVGDFYDEEMWK